MATRWKPWIAKLILQGRRNCGIVCCLLLSALVTMSMFEDLMLGSQKSEPAPKANNIPAGNPNNGKRLFETQSCGKCHGSEGQGGAPADKNVAPQIAPTRLSQAAFLGFVRNPVGQMRPYGRQQISDSEMADVYAYLQSLAVPLKAEVLSSANAESGARLYASYGCYECHGGQGQGSTQTGGSRLGPTQIPFSAFVSYVRSPTGQMPPYKMKVISDSELAQIYVFLQARPEAISSKSIGLLNQ
jgi:mono/diheme cytochrome c family protein